MRNNYISKTLLFALGLGCSLSVSAREYMGGPAQSSGSKPNNGMGNKVNASCLTSSSFSSLDINNVRAGVLNGGDMWWDLSNPRYEIPKVTDPSLPKKHSIFAGAVWIGGKDPQNNLYLAAQNYRQGNPNTAGYWPGPLDATGNIDKETCSAWNYHAKIDKALVDKFREDYAKGTYNANTDPADLPKEIREWPAKNNPHIRTTNMNYDLAPFVNAPGVGSIDAYEPLLGDYPDFQGDQAIWWVMNDAGNVKEPLSKKIGLELQVLAFAFQTNDLINNMTFYKQILKNKGSNQLKDTYLGQWVDPDLGYYNDDFVGCDVTRGLGICYNGDNDDEGVSGYGLNPPAVGVDFFKGPVADPNDGIDNNRDGVIDEPGETIIMSSFIYYNNNSNGTNGEPHLATEFYNYLQAIWKDGKKITFGKDGLDQTQPAYKFMFPDLSDPKGYGFSNPPTNPPTQPPFQGWTEFNRDGNNNSNTPADRRFLQSAGPFTLNPGSVNELTIGVVWANASSGGAQGSLGLLKYADDKAQKLFDNDFILPQGPDAPDLAITELDRQLILTLIPKRTATSSTETYAEEDKSLKNNINVKDPVYRFEGYKVYQLKDLNVTASDLGNIDKARIVAQGDIKNGVSDIINYEFDATLNQSVPKLRVKGSDKGVFHTLNINTDLFATGNDRIVNFKSYHYMVVAYAYNGDPANTDDKYLEGRHVSVQTGVPHKAVVENSGTVLTSAYGTNAEITRVFGTGNGGNILEIIPQDEQDIMAKNSKQLITYQKNHAPFVVKVYDPKIVQGGDFNVKLSSRLAYKKSSLTGALKTVAIGDTLLSTGNYTQSSTYNALTSPNKVSMAQVPGRAIVRRIIGASPIKNATGSVIDSLITLDIEMLNDHLNGRFMLEVDLYQRKNANTINDDTNPIGYTKESRPFIVTNKNFTASASEFALNDFWYMTMPTGDKVFADRPISEFNEQIVFDPKTKAPYGIAIEFKNTSNPGDKVLINPLNGFQEASVNFSGSKWYDGVQNGATTTDQVQWLMKKAVPGTPNKELTDLDPNYVYLNVLKGSWAPYGVTSTDPGPAYIATNPTNRKLYDLQNIDIVMTSDKSKWTRVPVLQGNAATATFKLTKADSDVPSVDKDGNPDGTMSEAYPNQPSVSMGWFPGYAIDLDKGIRLNMMFAEYGKIPGDKTNANGDKGRDLIWDPNSDVLDRYGRNYIYIANTKYDEGKELGKLLDRAKYDPALQPQTAQRNFVSSNIFSQVTWVGFPKLVAGQQKLNGDVRVRLRVNRAFISYNSNDVYNVTDDNKPKAYTGVNTNPEYNFSTNGLVPQLQQTTVAKSALDLIRVVPNPYYAYSQYEQRQLDNIVKITNLPRKCKIHIFTVNGTLVRTFSKDDAKTYLDWNLKNDNNLPISSGAYIINVDAGNIGNKVVKFFGIMRPMDLESF